MGLIVGEEVEDTEELVIVVVLDIVVFISAKYSVKMFENLFLSLGSTLIIYCMYILSDILHILLY